MEMESAAVSGGLERTGGSVMYKVVDKIPGRWDSKAKGKPIVVLEDYNGGQSVIAKDDGCYVLYNGSEDRDFGMVSHWYPEAANALTWHLVNPPKGNLLVLDEQKDRTKLFKAKSLLSRARRMLGGKEIDNLSDEISRFMTAP